MSSFTLDFNNIGKAIKRMTVFKEVFIEGETPNDLFRKLVQTNALAVKIQYNLNEIEIDSEDIRQLEESNYDTSHYELVSLAQAFKTLRCWVYNTEEFDYPGCKELIDRISILLESLEEVIAQSDYDQAEWG